MESYRSLSTASQFILTDLEELLCQLTDVDFAAAAGALHGATIGQHVRHTLEFFFCLQEGVSSGRVNYDGRAHSRELETSRTQALSSLRAMKIFIAEQPPHRDLWLVSDYSLQQDQPIQLVTNYQRELAYNVEHAIHHMALIKIGLSEVAPHVQVPKHFGVAVSTLRHQSTSPVLAG